MVEARIENGLLVVAAVNAYVGQFLLPRSHGLMVNGLEIPARVLGLHVLAGVVYTHRREGHLDNERLGTGAEGEVALGVAPVGHIAAGVHLAARTESTAHHGTRELGVEVHLACFLPTAQHTVAH